MPHRGGKEDSEGVVKMSEKPNCYKCKHRGIVPGSAHSTCNHPKTKAAKDDPMLMLTAMLGGGPNMIVDAGKLGVKGDLHGVKNGWFN